MPRVDNQQGRVWRRAKASPPCQLTTQVCQQGLQVQPYIPSCSFLGSSDSLVRAPATFWVEEALFFFLAGPDTVAVVTELFLSFYILSEQAFWTGSHILLHPAIANPEWLVVSFAELMLCFVPWVRHVSVLSRNLTMANEVISFSYGTSIQLTLVYKVNESPRPMGKNVDC